MENKRTLLISTIIALALALAAGLTRAQGPEPPAEAVEPESGSAVEAAVAGVIPIQGRLTDASGNPLNGNHSITFKLYEAASGGSAVCSTIKTVYVSNGLFSDYMNCASGIIDGRQLYLGIKVENDSEMIPRQPVYVVPYAWSLMPATSIKGATVSSAILEVRNDGTGPALYASGNGIIKSTAATDWVVSPLKVVPGDYGSNWDDLKIILSAQHGFAKLYTDGQDDCRALLPVDVVAYLFGTRVKLSAFHFCYRMDNTDEKITQVDVDYVGDDGVAHNLGSYTLDVSSTTWACRDLTLTSPAGIYGPVFMRFHLHFAGDGSSRSIRLGHMYLHLTE